MTKKCASAGAIRARVPHVIEAQRTIKSKTSDARIIMIEGTTRTSLSQDWIVGMPPPADPIHRQRVADLAAITGAPRVEQLIEGCPEDVALENVEVMPSVGAVQRVRVAPDLADATTAAIRNGGGRVLEIQRVRADLETVLVDEVSRAKETE